MKDNKILTGIILSTIIIIFMVFIFEKNPTNPFEGKAGGSDKMIDPSGKAGNSDGVVDSSNDKTGEKDGLAASSEKTGDRPADISHLPKKAGLVITFDDKSVNDWLKLLPVLEKYKARATFFVCKFHELSRQEIEGLHKLEKVGCEIACHSYSHKNAVEFAKESSVEEYMDKEIKTALANMKKEGFEVKSFAYPYGVGTEELDAALLKEFAVIRRTAYSTEGSRIPDFNPIYYKVGGSYKLISAIGLDAPYGNSMEEIKKGLDRAKKNDEIICFYGHDIKDEGKYARSLADYEEIISYASRLGLEFYNIKDLAGSN